MQEKLVCVGTALCYFFIGLGTSLAMKRGVKTGKVTLSFDDNKLTSKMVEMRLTESSEEPKDYNEGKAAINLQHTWTKAYVSRDEIRTEHQRDIVSRGRPALSELLQAGVSYEDEMFFKKLVTLCVTMSGLGSHLNNAVVKETYPALSSVLKSGDVIRLIELPRSDKEHHLLELVQIVMGIRLFNKDSHKGGEGIDDLPELLTQAISVYKTQITDLMKQSRNRCQKLSTVLLAAYQIDEVDDTPKKLTVAHEFSHVDVEKIKTQLSLQWILSAFFRKLCDDLSESEERVTTCVAQLGETLMQLHETVRYRVAIPTVQVYPLFVQLSLVWRELQYEAAALGHIGRMLKILSATFEESNITIKHLDAPPLPKSVRFQLRQPKDGLKYGGFCPWTLLQTDGLLYPGSAYSDDYAFRNVVCGEAWLKDGKENERAMCQMLEHHEELRLFLGLPICTKERSGDKTESRSSASVEVQTETHPIESHIDPNYLWSEWELKKKSVQIARISRCCTKSQQTT